MERVREEWSLRTRREKEWRRQPSGRRQSKESKEEYNMETEGRKEGV